MSSQKLCQFQMTDRKFVIQDVEFWASSMDAFLQFYREAVIDSEKSLAAKALACARLAGFAHAMEEHFSAGVDSLVDTTKESEDLSACMDSGARAYEMCEGHSERLETRARAEVS